MAAAVLTGRSEWLGIDWREHQRWVRVDARSMNLVDLGPRDGGEPVVFVHGLSGCWRNWLENIPHFARSRRVERLVLVAAAGITSVHKRSEPGLAALRTAEIAIAYAGGRIAKAADRLARRPGTRIGALGFVAAHPSRLPAPLVAEQLRGVGSLPSSTPSTRSRTTRSSTGCPRSRADADHLGR